MAVKCPRCRSENIVRYDANPLGKHTYICYSCQQVFEKTSKGSIVAGALGVAASVISIIHNGHDPNSGNHNF